MAINPPQSNELPTALPQPDDELAEQPTIALKGQVEAALFVTNQPLSALELAEQLGSDPLSVEEALLDLINDYAFRPDTALEIGDDADGYILQVRQEYQPVAHAMMPMEVPASTLRILSAIAIKGPILQSELVETQGSSVYDAVPELLDRGLVTKNRVGRSYRLNVTQKFYEYFRLVGDKQELRSMVNLLEGEPEAGLKANGQAIRLKDGSSGDGAGANDIGDDTQAKLAPLDDDQQ